MLCHYFVCAYNGSFFDGNAERKDAGAEVHKNKSIEPKELIFFKFVVMPKWAKLLACRKAP